MEDFQGVYENIAQRRGGLSLSSISPESAFFGDKNRITAFSVPAVFQ